MIRFAAIGDEVVAVRRPRRRPLSHHKLVLKEAAIRSTMNSFCEKATFRITGVAGGGTTRGAIPNLVGSPASRSPSMDGSG